MAMIFLALDSVQSLVIFVFLIWRFRWICDGCWQHEAYKLIEQPQAVGGSQTRHKAGGTMRAKRLDLFTREFGLDLPT